MYRGQVQHPVFVVLAITVQEFTIPREPFADLLVAFRQDQTKTRYDSLQELLEYCRYSANPVGRLVLYLGQAHSERAAEFSDEICTGLQLANFWQDVARDWQRGRVYLPQAECRRIGYTEKNSEWGQATASFKQLLASLVADAERRLNAGRPLIEEVSRDLRWEVDLFIRGGLATLASIRRIDYDVWSRRPTVSKAHKLMLLGQAWWQSWAGGNR